MIPSPTSSLPAAPDLLPCPACGTVLRFKGAAVTAGNCPACGVHFRLDSMPVEAAPVTARSASPAAVAPAPTATAPASFPPPPAAPRVPPPAAPALPPGALEFPATARSAASQVAPGAPAPFVANRSVRPAPAAPAPAAPAPTVPAPVKVPAGPTPDPHRPMPAPSWRQRLGWVADQLDTLTGQAIASGILVGMVVFSVLLFLKLDKKRTAQAINRSLPAAPAQTEPQPGPAPLRSLPQPVVPEVPRFEDAPTGDSFNIDSRRTSTEIRLDADGPRADELTVDDLKLRR